jgi:signal peptidase II
VKRQANRTAPLVRSAVLGVALFAIDQALKALAMNVQYEYRCLAGDFFCFGLAENARSAFGLVGADSVWFVVIVPIVLAALAAVVVRFVPRPWSYYVVALLSVGALSNWLDRLRLGHVVDYFGIRLPTVNLADYCVVAAVALLLYARARRGTPAPTS